MTNSNVSNENEATQTSNQTIVEKHDDKKTSSYDTISRRKRRTSYQVN